MQQKTLDNKQPWVFTGAALHNDTMLGPVTNAVFSLLRQVAKFSQDLLRQFDPPVTNRRVVRAFDAGREKVNKENIFKS